MRAEAHWSLTKITTETPDSTQLSTCLSPVSISLVQALDSRPASPMSWAEPLTRQELGVSGHPSLSPSWTLKAAWLQLLPPHTGEERRDSTWGRPHAHRWPAPAGGPGSFGGHTMLRQGSFSVSSLCPMEVTGSLSCATQLLGARTPGCISSGPNTSCESSLCPPVQVASRP